MSVTSNPTQWSMPASPTGPAYNHLGVETSHQVGQLAAAMAKAQAEIVNPGFDSENPAFHSKYTSLAAVVAEVRRAFSMHELAVFQPVCSDHDDKGMLYGCQTLIIHSSGEWIRSICLLPVIEEGRQSVTHTIGALLTYAKKYSLISICLICGDEDLDGNDAGGGSKKKDDIAPQRKPAPAPQEPGSGTRKVATQDDPPVPNENGDEEKKAVIARENVKIKVMEWTKCHTEDLGRIITIIGGKLNLRKRNNIYNAVAYDKIAKYAVLSMSDGLPWEALDPIKD